jgi:3-phosphoshikimate 1-carboxyvinyltransferase
VAELTVGPSGPIRGRLRMPGDKSISHRALLLAALAEGRSSVGGLSDGADVVGTRRAIEALGAATDDVDGRVVVDGGGLHEPEDVIDVGNSGTTIRLLTGLCAALPFLTVLAGDESIARRPMDRVAVPLRLMGATIEGRDDGRFPPLSVRGGDLHGITYRTPVPSAQVKSAVLLAGLGADGDTVVEEDVPTRAHTEELLARFGADVEVDDGRVRVRRSRPEPFTFDIPGDPSQAAFWVVAATLVPGSDLVIEDLYLGPARSGFLDVLVRMGADLEIDHDPEAGTGTVRVRPAALHGTTVAGAEIVGLDEVPALAIAAGAAEGMTRFVDVGELRVKESDRLATVSAALRAVGGTAEVDGDALVIDGGTLRGGVVASHGDHRIAMAAAVAGLASVDAAVTIEGWEAVATSYPRFEQDLGECRT